MGFAFFSLLSFLAYFLEIEEITEVQNYRSNFQRLKYRVELCCNSASLHKDHQDFVHLAQRDFCLTQSMVQAVCEPVQNNESSCSANDFVFFKIFASLLGRSILKIIGTPERMDSYSRCGCMERFHFIFVFCTRFLFLHKVHLTEFT